MTYTLIVALIGMLIVFTFLLLLSLLMAATKRALKDRTQENATASDVSALRSKAGSPDATIPPENPTPEEASKGAPPWLMAAVVAFVLAEQEAHSAGPWIQGRKQ
jgi:hypothetical protein